MCLSFTAHGMIHREQERQVDRRQFMHHPVLCTRSSPQIVLHNKEGRNSQGEIV